MTPINLSPSKVASYENCPRAYLYQYVLRIRNTEESVNLGFGSAIGTTVEKYILSTVDGKPNDPEQTFLTTWSAFLENNVVTFPAKFTKDDLTDTGMSLARQLAGAWEDTGYMACVDREGVPVLERNLSVNVGNGVTLNTKLDILVMNLDGEVGVVDAKSPAQESSELFVQNAEQLTAYQVAVDAHAEALGIPKVDFVSYWEMLKKRMPGPKSPKTYLGPVICQPKPVQARDTADVEDYVGKLHAVAESIRAKRFHKSPRMAFNTPCNMCSFSKLCVEKNQTGFVIPQGVDTKALLKAA